MNTILGQARVVVVGTKTFAADTGLVGSLGWASSSLLMRVGSLVVSMGLVASRGPLIVGVAGEVGIAGRHQVEPQSSLLEPGSPVGDLHDSRQTLPDVGGQAVDCHTCRADMAGRLVDDTGRRHTIPDEYLGAAVDTHTHCRHDCCLPATVAAVAWGSPCL